MKKAWDKSPENPMVAAQRLKESEGKWSSSGGGGGGSVGLSH